MTTLEQQPDHAVIKLTSHELIILNNALNEVCNALDWDELATRMGASFQEVSALLAQINSLIRKK